MNYKVTKHSPEYPQGQKPDFICPKEYAPYRYSLGKKGTNIFVAICMNPSAAREDSSDMTVNRIISYGQKLDCKGWAIFNTYPERATAAKNIGEYDKKLSDENIKVIKEFLQKNKIKEVFGAWGDLKYKPLQEGKNKLVAMLADINVEIFYFGTLTKQGNPRHPLQRYEKIEVKKDKKQYLKSL